MALKITPPRFNETAFDSRAAAAHAGGGQGENGPVQIDSRLPKPAHPEEVQAVPGRTRSPSPAPFIRTDGINGRADISMRSRFDVCRRNATEGVPYRLRCGNRR